MLSVGHTVTTSVGMCDIDIRPVRYSVLCNFFMHGFDGFKMSVILKKSCYYKVKKKLHSAMYFGNFFFGNESNPGGKS